MYTRTLDYYYNNLNCIANENTLQSLLSLLFFIYSSISLYSISNLSLLFLYFLLSILYFFKSNCIPSLNTLLFIFLSSHSLSLLQSIRNTSFPSGVIGRGYFCEERFPNSEVVDLLKSLVPLTRLVWQKVKAKMLPTPAKFHYVFNLRDLSRVWRGMLRVQPDQCRDSRVLINLWKHELTRVISDRLRD